MKTKKILFIISIFILGLVLGLILNSKRNTENKSKKIVEQSQKVEYWTCSMHPQIHLPEPGDCPICGMELIPENNLKETKINKFETMLSDDAAKIANIQTSVVEFAKPQKEIILQGMVMPDESKITTQSVHFDGRIEKLYVNFVGQKVYKGQKIVTIYSPDLITAQQELLQAKKYKTSNPLLYEAAKNKLKYWKLTDNQINNIEQKGEIIENFDILSETSGYISEINIKNGDYVKSGTELFQIENLSNVWIVFDAYEKDLPFLKVGNSITFTINSIANKKFSTKINFISPIIDEKKRTYDIRTQVSNPNILLKTGMFAQGIVQATLNTKKDVLIIPKSAVLWTGTRSVVYIKEKDNSPTTYQLRVVELGNDLGTFYEISNGLNQGEEIVTNGAFNIDAAAELAGNYSMMNLPENEIDNINLNQTENVSETFVNQVNNLIKAYFELSNYLIAASPENTKKQAQKIKNLAEKIDLNSVSKDYLSFWKDNLKIIDEQSQNMIKMDNIDMQRKHYQTLSEAIIKLVKNFGHLNEPVYVQFCPMYNNNKGAFWLSNFKEIKNPYFGDLMLTCGSTKQTINN